jgi:hypothetical protein
MLYKLIHNFVPPYMLTLKPSSVSETTSYILRNATHLVLPTCHTSAYQRSFLHHTITDWNKLNREIISSKSQTSFKHKIKVKFTPIINPLYNHGFGKPQINLCRMRLGTSGLNQHLFKCNMIIYSYSCPFCVNTTESPTHYFIMCPQYAAERDRMLKAVLLVLCPNVHHSLLLPPFVDYIVSVLLRGSDDLSLLENKLIFDAIFSIYCCNK